MDLEFHVVEELLSLKNELKDVKQPQEEAEGVVESTHAETCTKDGRKHTREGDILFLDVRDNVGAPTSQHRQRRSRENYIRYIALMSEGIEI